MMYEDKFRAELTYAIKVIREWDNLSWSGRLTRQRFRPSSIDFRIINKWLDSGETKDVK